MFFTNEIELAYKLRIYTLIKNIYILQKYIFSTLSDSTFPIFLWVCAFPFLCNKLYIFKTLKQLFSLICPKVAIYESYRNPMYPMENLFFTFITQHVTQRIMCNSICYRWTRQIPNHSSSIRRERQVNESGKRFRGWRMDRSREASS